jgi:uncharacterized protein YegJ (DUF2314 family)
MTGHLRLRTGLAGLAFVTAFAWFSCGRRELNAGFKSIAQAENDDPILRTIALGAQERLAEFTRKLRNPADDEYNFQVKYPFASDPGSEYTHEHLWIKDIEFKDGKFHGTLSNSPLYIQGLALGDRVEFFLDDISDWMYMKQGRIQGGQSIKYLIEKIPPADRDDALRQYLELFE